MDSKKGIAISVENVSKTFRIPHEKITSLRGAAIGAFSRKGGYEEFNALDDVSFEVKKGEFFGIIGRNGSGKSTLLKILAGIYQADKGTVSVNGRISPFLELGIGFNPELSGRDNVYLNATVLGLTKKEIDKKFDSIVAFSELERFIDQKLKNYSSGMQVRLAFSVSVHANREILLMDEVLAVGDSNFASKCLNEFAKYRDMGKTVVLVTHDIATVQRYCDRAMLLRNGKIVKIGEADEVGDKYVYQNMSDEDKRISYEEKTIPAGDAFQSFMVGEKNIKSVEITNVAFLDKDGKEKSVFITGDDISVRIYFKLNKPLEKINFGFGLYNSDNNYIFDSNTMWDKADTNAFLKKGYAQINFKNIPLKTGSYHIKTSILKDNFNSFYDYLGKSQSFSIQSLKKTHGIIELDFNWK